MNTHDTMVWYVVCCGVPKCNTIPILMVPVLEAPWVNLLLDSKVHLVLFKLADSSSCQMTSPFGSFIFLQEPAFCLHWQLPHLSPSSISFTTLVPSCIVIASFNNAGVSVVLVFSNNSSLILTHAMHLALCCRSLGTTGVEMFVQKLTNFCSAVS